jgi:hypothetical protein
MVSLEICELPERLLEHTNHSNMTRLETAMELDVLGSLIEEAILAGGLDLSRTLSRVRLTLHAQHDE